VTLGRLGTRLAFQALVSTAAPPTADPVIQARNVTRTFGGRRVVDDISFDVPAGALLGIVGPSGSGKTTTVRMLTGTLGRTEGEIRVLGEDPMRFSRRVRSQIAYMPQLFSLYEDLSAQENVGFVAALYGIGPFARRKRTRRALETVDLFDVRHRLARNLSGGEQRRLELACALVHSPTVLFVDEPTAGVDPLLRQSIWDELRRHRDDGCTLLVTTQYVGEAEYCDRVAMILAGALVALDTPEALRKSVYGGEVIEVHADRPVQPELLANVPGVLAVQQPGPMRLTVTTRDAETTSPQIMEVLRRSGVGVTGLAEYQPSFDDVFSGLVEQRRNGAGANDEAGSRGAHDRVQDGRAVAGGEGRSRPDDA
jgi:ABC-2 type transport system ATP-binding protein